MIIEYQMRYAHPANDRWVNFAGEFLSWDAFYRFEQLEKTRKREIRAARVQHETKLEPSAFCQYCHYKKEHCCCDLEIDYD